MDAPALAMSKARLDEALSLQSFVCVCVRPDGTIVWRVIYDDPKYSRKLKGTLNKFLVRK